jgi:uncharacterized protein YpbB
MKSRPTPHIVLTKEQAIEIFLAKYSRSNMFSITANSAALAGKFKVSAKTVRDIWSGRSWLNATYDLWHEVRFSLMPANVMPNHHIAS